MDAKSNTLQRAVIIWASSAMMLSASSGIASRASWPYISLSALQEDTMPSIDDEDLARQVRACMARVKAKRRKLMSQAGGQMQVSLQR